MSSTSAVSKYPRVTEILKSYTGYDNVPKQILENAAARGTTVHALCAGIAKGVWIPDAIIQEDHRGYIDSFKKWHQASRKEYLVIEKRYTDEGFGYSGQVDYVIKDENLQTYLIDIKTSAKPQKTYPIQMAAYKLLLKLNGIEINGAALVYLDKDGEYPRVDFYENLDEELEVFMCALECWNYFYKPKEKNGNKT
jgi:hypothetical protein